jgi:hypothetical protein
MHLLSSSSGALQAVIVKLTQRYVDSELMGRTV